MQEDQAPDVGANIRRIRREQGLTLETLSEKSGVSKSMLSQIEGDKVNPTLATVWKIARGLDVDLDSLIAGGNRPVRRFSITHHGDLTILDRHDGGPILRVLTPLEMAEDLEMYDLRFPPGSALRSRAHAPRTTEHVTVISGSIRVTAGDRSADLETGDFILYSCDVDHDIANRGSDEARVHLVVRFDRPSLG